MATDKEFPAGLFVSPPRQDAPGFVKGRISIRVAEFLKYLIEKDGEWLRIDLKESMKKDEEGNPKWYAEADTWVKPSERASQGKGDGDALPF